MTRIAGHEDARDARFEQVWRSSERPARRETPVPQQVGAGDEKPMLISQHGFTEPVGMRRRADENKQRLRDHCPAVIGFGVLEHQGLQSRRAVGFGYFHAGLDDDIRRVFQTFDLIVRHGLGEGVAANEHRYLPGVPRKIDGRLPG